MFWTSVQLYTVPPVVSVPTKAPGQEVWSEPVHCPGTDGRSVQSVVVKDMGYLLITGQGTDTRVTRRLTKYAPDPRWPGASN